MSKFIKLYSIAIISLFSTLVMAQNNTISIQSTLKNISGDAVPDGEQSITFKLYTTLEGGTAVWEEMADVEVVSGIYSHELGSVVPLVTSDFGQQLYLGVTVNNKELAPRTKLGFAPYAMAVSALAANGESASFGVDGTFIVTDSMSVLGKVETAGELRTKGPLWVTENHASLQKGAFISDFLNVYANIKAFEKMIIGGGNVTPTHQLSLGHSTTGITGSGGGINFYINSSNTSSVVINDNRLGVGVGAQPPKTTLHVGNANQQIAGWSSTSNAWFGPVSNGISNTANDTYIDICALFEESILIKNKIISDGTVSFSDHRIKYNLHRSNAKSDLALLNKIEITEYDHIDKINKDRRRQKKVIAQQVEEVLPNAVSKMRSVIPNVYEGANSFDYMEGKLEINTNKAHEFSVGDKIDLKTPNKDLSEVEVIAVIDAHTFTVKAEEKPENVFVYGKYVDDFRIVDYDAIAMLNVSASQEMYRMIMDLQAANKKLTEENKALKSASASIEDRLSMLEAMMVKSEENNTNDTYTVGK